MLLFLTLVHCGHEALVEEEMDGQPCRSIARQDVTDKTLSATPKGREI